MSRFRFLLALAVAFAGVAASHAVAEPDPGTFPADTITITVNAEAGDVVTEGDVILTLEAATTDDGVCEDKPCAEGEVCDKAPCDGAAAEVAGDSEVAADAADVADADEEGRVYPTHHQTKVISVNPSELTETSLHSFCLAPSGDLLAACDNEVRVFTGDGEYVTSWELPVTPEAINVGSDGRVYVAGQGQLLRLSTEGEVLSEVRSPLVDSLEGQRDKIRKDVIKQAKRNTELYANMRKQYAEQVTELEAKQAAAEQAEEAEEAAEEDAGEQAETPAFTASDEQQLKMAQQMVEQMDDIIEQLGGQDEMTEEEIEKRVDDAMEYKLRVASISEADGEVFLATSAPTGYGYAVWRMSRHFDSQKMIAKDLRGCCGQMDVQVNEHGVFVAENSRDRVCRFNREGKLVCEWGHSARQGLEGFGSCCNPMNVNFGPEGSVYTAESGTGRIKRYSTEGELLDLVGKVDLVPGCKKVAIAATPDGDRIYMLDITRHHIVMMERYGEGETGDYFEVRASQRKNPSTASNPLSGLFGVFTRVVDGE